MSTVSGVFPNAITPSFAPTSDPAEQARLRRQNESAVFSPVEEIDQNSETRPANIEQPGRLEAESATNVRPQLHAPEQSEPEVTETAQAEKASQPDSISERATQRDPESTQRAEQQPQAGREDQTRQESADLQGEIELIRELASRDREVRAHEQAHQASGGEYAGAAVFSYRRGPDGKQYAVGGEVSIDISRESSPADTIDKAERVRRAALAPAEPSAQDRRVAALASQLVLEAQAALRTEERQKTEKTEEESAEQDELQVEEKAKVAKSDEEESAKDEEASGDSEERLDEILTRTAETVAAALNAAYQTQSAKDVGFNLDTTV
jgi:hypothetical protein